MRKLKTAKHTSALFVVAFLSVSSASAQQLLYSGGSYVADGPANVGFEYRQVMPPLPAAAQALRVKINSAHGAATALTHVAVCSQLSGSTCKAAPIEETCAGATGAYLAANAPDLQCDPVFISLSAGEVPLIIFEVGGSGVTAINSGTALLYYSQPVPPSWDMAMMGGTINSVANNAAIEEVDFYPAISQNLPFIASVSDPELDPTKKIILDGAHFGPQGRVKLVFQTPSAVPFECLPPPGNLPCPGSTKELFLNATTWTPTHIETTPIDVASPWGAVVAQGVSITLVGGVKGEPTSNTIDAKFRNDAVITGVSTTVGPSKMFWLRGWDFGEAGTLNVHFTKPPHDRNVPTINQWFPFEINATMPAVTGEVAQPVEISFTTKDGRKSNKWQANFFPRMVLKELSWQDVTVDTCSSDGNFNVCYAAGAPSLLASGCFFGGDNDPVTTPILTFYGAHTNCYGPSSANGPDIYAAAVQNGWSIQSLDFVPMDPQDPTMVGNGSVNSNYTSLPSNAITVTVPWHIGATGGYVNYTGGIWAKGPDGVPYN
jgi:hypothetical protein